MFDLPKYEQTRKLRSFLIQCILNPLTRVINLQLYHIFANVRCATLFFNAIFDQFLIAVIRVSPEMEEYFRILREHVDKTLKKSAFQNVKLADIFRKMMPNQNTASKGSN